MKTFKKFNNHFSNVKKFRSFNKLLINPFSSHTENVARKSHLQQISERDNEFVEKIILNSHNYTAIDFSNFLRVTLKTRNPEYLDVFAKEAPKHIPKLDDTDLRKVMSIVIANSELQSQSDLIEMIRIRNLELNNHNDASVRKDFYDFSHLQYSVRFWMFFARTREAMYRKIRSWGLNLK